jgi:hypothetical protein
MQETQITIEQAKHVPIGELAKSAIADLYRLHGEAKTNLEGARRLKEWIESAIALKYEEKAKAKRLRFVKDTGIIHLEDNGFKVSCDVAKKVEWDQQKLAKIASDIMTSGGNLDDYIEIHYNVSERTYNSWSEPLRNVFNSARSVRLGRPTYKLVRLEGDGGDL